MNKTHAMCWAAALITITALPSSAGATEIQMPLRGDGFESSQTHYTTGGHKNYNCGPNTPAGSRVCELDFGAKRWDTVAGTWTDQLATPDPDYPEANIIWDAPVYAPVDGEIIACWRNMPDDDVEGDDYSCPGGNEIPPSQTPDDNDDGMCARRGNHLIIRTGTGELVGINHLKDDSIPTELCPKTGAYLYRGDSVSCDIYDDARLEDASGNVAPIPILKGEYVGRVGNSGASSGPHLHVEVYQDTDPTGGGCKGNDLPIEFSESWSAPLGSGPLSSDDWTPLEAERLAIGNGTLALWPDPIGPRTDSVALEGGSRPAVAMTSAGGVVAFRDSNGDLSTIAFAPDSQGELLLGPQATAGSVERLDVAKIGASSRHVVVAVQNGQGNLQLLPYYVTSSRSLIRGGGVTSSAASRIALTRAPNHSGVVAAVRNGSGTLTVRDFGVSSSGTQLTVSTGGSATSNASIVDVAADRIVAGRARNETSGAFQGVVTAERRGDHRLVVRTWEVTPQGNVTLIDSHLATWAGQPLLVEDVAVSVVGTSGREFAAVSVRTRGSDALRVQSYEISRDGDISYIEGHGSGTAQIVTSATAGSADIALGLLDGDGELRGLTYEVSLHTTTTDGGQVRRIGTREAGTINDLDIGVRANQGDMLFAVVDSVSEIRLIRYLANFSSTM